MRYQNLVTQSSGYWAEPDFKALRAAHAGWNAECAKWRRTRMLDPSKELSHLKILALLLFELARTDWVKELQEFDPEKAQRDTQFAGTDEEREEVRKDIAGGRGTYLAFQFVAMVINWFETARTDRIQKFEYRGTLDLEHDILSYLSSNVREQMATYLILKALYARDPTPDAASN